MEIERDKLYAVATGDIIGSSRLPEDKRRNLPEVMKDGVKALNDAFDDVSVYLHIFRGDSWQLLITDPVKSLRLCLFFRAYLLANTSEKVDTRLAIAVGTLDFFNEERISEGDGEAYRKSGRAFEKMPKSTNMQVDLPGPETGRPSTLMNAVIRLLDELVKRWTPKQAQAIMGALQGWTQKEIAASWGDTAITQQAVAQHLNSAGWDGCNAGLVAFEHHVVEIVKEHALQV